MRLFRYILVNAALAAAMWFGFFKDVPGAQNLAQFFAWFVFVLSLFFFSKDVADAAAKVPKKIPRWLDNALDVATCAVFVWFGWWWTAAAYLMANLLVHGLTDVARDRMAKEAK